MSKKSTEYSEFLRAMQRIVPPIAIMSEKHWIDEGRPSPDEFFINTRGFNYEMTLKYPDDTARSLARKKANKEAEDKAAGKVKRGKGRPKKS